MEKGIFQRLKRAVVEERVAVMTVDEVPIVAQPDGSTLVRIPEPPTPFAALRLIRLKPWGAWHLVDHILIPGKEEAIAPFDPEIEQSMPEHL